MPTTPQTNPAPTPAANGATAPREGFFDGLVSRLSPTAPNAAPNAAPAHRDLGNLAKSALPLLVLAARRVPVGLLVLGVAAAGVAMANPTTRAKVVAAGRKGLATLKR